MVERIRSLTTPYTRGRGLDVGCGHERLWPHSIGIDGFVSPNGAVLCADARVLTLFADACMDYVFASDLLTPWDDADIIKGLKEWWRLIRESGHLVLYHPVSVSPKHIKSLMEKHCPGWVLVEYDINDNAFIVFRKTPGKVCVNSFWKKPNRPNALVVRYGGFGDMIQAASFFPALAQTHDIWVNTTPSGREILRNNPYVDEFLLQDTNQVPNEYLSTYWRALEERFDVVINLSESVEGALLALPGRPNSFWSRDRLREKVGGINYFERAFEIAGLPFGSVDKGFYPTDTEVDTAKAFKQECGGPLVIWSLSGSAVHKAYPWTDAAIAEVLLKHPTVNIVLVGDELCEILEGGWTSERRVHRRSGKLSIRDTLALVEQAEVVVGPETGVLNFAGVLPHVHSVVMLSHSSPDNLTKYWRNNTVLRPINTPCHPCHVLHYGNDRCSIDQSTGAAMCAYNIAPADVAKSILGHL